MYREERKWGENEDKEKEIDKEKEEDEERIVLKTRIIEEKK